MQVNRKSDLQHFLRIILFTAFFIILIRNAWISQRAYLNFRVVENLIHGYGLGVNPGERVLPVNQPLWPIILAALYSLTQNVLNLPLQNHLYVLSLTINLVCSLSVALLILRLHSSSNFALILTFVPLMLSKSLIDYSTSGLETSLLYVLITGIFLLYIRQRDKPLNRDRTRMIILYIFAAVIMMVQWELTILSLALIVWIALQSRNDPKLRWLWLVPIILALIYGIGVGYLYGSPLPNMYVSRFSAGVGTGRLVRQGLMYLLHTVDFDPISIFVIVAAVIGVICLRKRELFPFAFGILGTIGLIVLFGGDSMGGRLLAPLVLVSALLIGQLDLKSLPEAIMSVLAISAIGILVPRSPVMSTYSYEYTDPDHRGIFDARGSDYPKSGLLRFNRISAVPPLSDWSGDDWVFDGYDDVLLADERGLGFQAYAAGPNVYILADTGLTDPLLARIPAEDRVIWDIDEMKRTIPDEYLQLILSDAEAQSCQPLTENYQELRQLVGGKVGSSAHMNAFVDLVFSQGIFAIEPHCE
jgi:arabinofuranosyltransferase